MSDTHSCSMLTRWEIKATDRTDKRRNTCSNENTEGFSLAECIRLPLKSPLVCRKITEFENDCVLYRGNRVFMESRPIDSAK